MTNLIKLAVFKGNENLVVTPPSWRSDIKIKEDLVEKFQDYMV